MSSYSDHRYPIKAKLEVARSELNGDSCGGEILTKKGKRGFVPVGEIDLEKTNPDLGESKRRSGDKFKGFNPGLARFFVNLPPNLQNGIKSRLETLERSRHGGRRLGGSPWKEGKSVDVFEAELREQLLAWKENPAYVDGAPEIKVSVPKGSFCNISARVNVGLPPDAAYNIVIDPDNKRVFKNIKEVISREVLFDDGIRQVVDVEQAAIWKFLWWSGTISVHVLVEQNRADHTMRFKQLKTGFMNKFEGCWRVEPVFVDEHICSRYKPKSWEDYRLCTGGKGRLASIASLEQVIQPALIPPPPISWYLRGITTKTTEMLINDFVAEAARIRGSSETVMESEALLEPFDQQMSSSTDIKERWLLRRRSTRQRSRCCRGN